MGARNPHLAGNFPLWVGEPVLGGSLYSHQQWHRAINYAGAAAISLNILGVFLHFASDAQKYYTLKYRPGLMTDGFFARCRNTNYLGEILIYSSFAILAQHWLPFLILAGFVGRLFVPNMLKKDQSLFCYPEFADYKSRSGLLFPRLFVPKTPDSEDTTLAQKT